MNTLPETRRAALAQTYLLERDANLMCRIMGLYAARGLDLLHADYAHAARDVMRLNVCVADAGDGAADTVRVLVEKAASFVGVIAACEQETAEMRVA